jgi:hypothetical protein
MRNRLFRYTASLLASGLLLLAALPTPADDTGVQSPPPAVSLFAELLVGVSQHDTDVFGEQREEGYDVNVEIRFRPFTILGRPSVVLGGNINTGDAISSGYLALNWSSNRGEPGFVVSFSLGAGVHDGELRDEPVVEERDLGSRVLFYLGLDIGWRFGHHGFYLHADHMSNAGLEDDNEGLDTFGIRYGYAF